MLIYVSTNISFTSAHVGSSAVSRSSLSRVGLSSELFRTSAILACFDVLSSSSVEPRSPCLCFPLIISLGIGKSNRYFGKD